MEQSPPTPARQWRKRVASYPLWIVVALLVVIACLHYFTSQTRSLPLPASVFLGRHAVERILFVLPVAIAAFAFGQAGGLVTLLVAILIMLPRVVWISPYPADAFVETAATALVGYLVIRVIDAQAREKALRQKTVSQLKAINAVAAIVTGSLELKRILNDALDKVLEVMGLESGLIFFLKPQNQELILVAHRGMSEEAVVELNRLQLDEGFCGRVAQSGELMVIQDSSCDPRLTRPVVREEGWRAQIVAPLKSKNQVQGVLAVATRDLRCFLPEELELVTAIGNQIGVAVENARLYDNLRFYVQEITQVQENERERIARELHDETIQMLIVISRRIEVLATLPDQLPKVATRHLESLQELVGDTLSGVRRFVRDLRPPTLDHLGLVAALEGLTGAATEKGEIAAELEVTGRARRLTPEGSELTLFRIAQEALNNVRRHSGASRVAVRVEFGPTRVRMVIEDDGCGFNAPERMGDLASSGKLGLIGMQERARNLSGTLDIQSEPGRGVTIIVDVPVQPRSE